MFVCEECAEKHLSEKAKRWPFAESYGLCELCDKPGTCVDVKSSWDWAWVSTSKENRKEATT